MEKGFLSPSGDYWQTISEPSEETVAAYPEGTIEVPIRPSHLHTWNGESWDAPAPGILNAYLSQIARDERNRRLYVEVDPVITNPFRWAEMPVEKQQVWIDYRRALLDLPTQPGFPHEIEWPVYPGAA